MRSSDQVLVACTECGKLNSYPFCRVGKSDLFCNVQCRTNNRNRTLTDFQAMLFTDILLHNGELTTMELAKLNTVSFDKTKGSLKKMESLGLIKRNKKNMHWYYNLSARFTIKSDT